MERKTPEIPAWLDPATEREAAADRAHAEQVIREGDRPTQLAALRLALAGALEIAVGRDAAAISREWRELLLELHTVAPARAPDLELLRDRLAHELVESGPRDVPALARELRATVKDLEAVGVGVDPASVSDRVAEQRRRRRAASENVLPATMGEQRRARGGRAGALGRPDL